MPARIVVTEAEVLARCTVDEHGCWLWDRCLDKDGYSKWRGTRGHRAVYEALVGPIPDGMHIDHLCRVRRCVNPAHLEAVTKQENQRRGLKGALTTHCPQGHAYDAANTRYWRGQRACKACNNAAARRYSERQKAGVR